MPILHAIPVTKSKYVFLNPCNINVFTKPGKNLKKDQGV